MWFYQRIIGANMNLSEIFVIYLCRERRARWKLSQKLIIHSCLPHTLSQCDMWFKFCSWSHRVLLLRTETWRILPVSAVVTTSKSIFKTTSSLSQIQQPKYGVIGVLWQNTSDVTRGEREIRFKVLFFKGLVQTRLSNESFAEFS